jgi:nitroreductase
MEAIDAILSRRSIRKYTDEPITESEETLLLKAAMSAPNTMNNRDWAFVIIREPQQLCNLADCLKPNAEPLRKAQMAIVVCGDLSLTLQGMEEYWIQDCSAATTNLLITANAMGLGAVWLGTYPQSYKVTAVARLLELPCHIQPLCVVAIGHPAEVKINESDKRYEPHKVHHEKW